MKQKNKFRIILQIFYILFIVIFTLFVFTPFVSALDNNNSMQQEENSEVKLSKDSSIQTPSSQQNEVQEKNIASGRFGSSDWKIDDSGCLHIGEGIFVAVPGTMSPWGVWKDQITSIVIEGRVILDSSSSYLFYDLRNVKTISGLTKVDTSRVIYMNSMFSGMYALTELDLSSFDTSEVTDMTGMFAYMVALRELDVSSFDTSKVKTFSGMFEAVSALEKLDIRNFNTSNASEMSLMFRAMNSLKK